MGILCKIIQLILEFLNAQCSIIGPTPFLLQINELPDDVICNIMIYAEDPTLCVKCYQASDMKQQLELAFELESINLVRKSAVDSIAGKTQLILSDQSLVLLLWKWMGLFLKKKSSFKMLALSFSSLLNCLYC